jgi:3-deoxy-7-phosphoheptulonate synthase
MPVAFKNSTSGSINVAVQGVLTAACPHTFFGVNDDGQASIVKTKGNPLTHIVLRGGETSPNYDHHSITKALELLRKNQQQERLIIDCSHDNSNRCHYKQKDVFKSVMQQYMDGNTAIRGLSLESNLFSGSQQVPLDRSRLRYAVSITDPCLDWEETEALIRQYASLSEHKLQTTLAEAVTSDAWAK